MSWHSIALSADGCKLVAGGWPSGDVVFPIPLFMSQDAGDTWTNTGDFTGVWESVAASGDGAVLMATSRGGHTWLSTNSGATWAEVAPTFPQCGVVSADGSTLVLAGSGLAVSRDGGATWNSCDVGYVSALASSRDGSMLAAAAPGSPDVGLPGVIRISRDFGNSWALTGAPSNYWSVVASSADGSRLAAVARGSIYMSADSGATWLSNSAPFLAWASLACSADGCTVIAAEAAGGIYAYQTTPRPILHAVPAGRGFLLWWIVPSTQCVLQESVDLSLQVWADVPEKPVLNPASLQQQLILKISAGAGFYRLRQ